MNKDFVTPGLHLLIDFWGGEYSQDIKKIETALRLAAEACGATVLDVQLHSFGEKAGITGVAVLAESHISIHTWPEIDYIALDVFVCGSCDAYKAVDVLMKLFMPKKHQISEHRRGLLAAEVFTTVCTQQGYSTGCEDN